MKLLALLFFTTLVSYGQPTLANSDDIIAAKARSNHTGTQSWNTITSTPTTLSGYGISDGVSTNGEQTLTNKTLTNPVITGISEGLTSGNVLTNANLTGHITSNGNACLLNSFTLTELNAAINDANVQPTANPVFTGTLTVGANSWDGSVISGYQSFTNQTRPSSNGSGEISANSLINSSDDLALMALSVARVRRMANPSSMSSVGTWVNTISNGFAINCYSYSVSSAGGVRITDSNETFKFSKPVKIAISGSILPTSTSSNCVGRIFLGNSGGALQLANATNPVIKAGYGVEFYAAGGNYRARLFWCSADNATVTFSGIGTGSGTCLVEDLGGGSQYGYLLENAGNGNLLLFITAQSTTSSNSNISISSPSITWTGGITNTTLTYSPMLQVIGATPSTAIVGGSAFSVYSAILIF